MRFRILGAFVALLPVSFAQAQTTLSPAVREFVTVDAPVVALTHVRVIDGTGAPAAADQTVVISGGKIAAVGSGSSVTVPSGARVVDLTGHTVIPGLVGMHDHTFYSTYVTGRSVISTYSFSRLYLGSGVTTIRTTGAMMPYGDLNLKVAIERGEMPGPHMYITGPYIIGPAFDPRLESIGANRTRNPEEAKRAVDYWADEGASWIKVYNSISKAHLAAVIEQAHKRGLKVTGHLCSVGYREAVALGIDHLEHGLFANAEYDPAKQPDLCPPTFMEVNGKLDMASAPVQATFKDLVSHNVGMTSTLAVYECIVPGRPTWDKRVGELMSAEALREDSTRYAKINEPGAPQVMVAAHRKAMEYEFAFAKAGGLLTNGIDPAWCNIAGYGDQHNFELLVESGFTPVQAVQIATSNGAKVLGAYDKFGSITVGKAADLAVIRGDLSAKASEIRNVTLVFKDGVGYDAAKLIGSIKGLVGIK